MPVGETDAGELKTMAPSERRAVCPACAADRVRVLATFADWRNTRLRGAQAVVADAVREAGLDAAFDFLRCTACGTVFIDPVPDAAGLAAFYDHYYVNRDYMAKAGKKVARAAKRIRRLFGDATPDRRRFIDIGCNAGFAVEAARRAGLDATGLEIDAAAAGAAARSFPGVRVINRDAADFAATGKRFDFLYCTEVIEHIPEPAPFVDALARLAAPGARLFLTTPDAGHFRVPRDFLSWAEVKPPEHVAWHTKAGLARLFNAHGFTVERFGFNLKPSIRMLARRA